MPKLIAALVAATALGASFIAASPARASDAYAWCATYGGRDGGGTNCGFVTLAQCRATIFGIGGVCYENPRYEPPRSKRYRKPR